MKRSKYGLRSKQRGFAAVLPAIIGGAASYFSSKKAGDAAGKAADSQAAIAAQQMQMAREQYEDWKSKYQPLEDQLIKEAKEYDTPQRREQMAAQAMGNSQLAVDNASRSLGNNLNERGVNPDSGQYQAGLRDIAIRGAAQTANSGNAARTQVENTGYARLAAAADRGRGLVNNANAAAAAGAGTFGNIAAQQNLWAQQQGAGVGNLAGKLGDAFTKWWNTPGSSSGGGGVDYGQYF